MSAVGLSTRERIDQANRLLSAHRYGSAEHERGYALMREAAEAADGAWARWLLGAYHLQVVQRPGAQQAAAHWLQRAAAAGIAPARERLADMALHALAQPFSPDEAYAHLRALADQGHAPSAWQAGYLADRAEMPSSDEAPATLFLRACALGFGPAYLSLGLRFASGQGVVRDPVLGRALLLRAADAGVADARESADDLVPDHLVPEGGAAAEQLRARLKQNLAEAQPLLAAVGRSAPASPDAPDPALPRLEAHLAAALPEICAIGADGRARVRDAQRAPAPAPVQWRWLSERPRVGIAEAFADREECAWLISKVADGMQRPQDIRRAHSANSDSEREQFDGLVRPLRMLETDPVMRLLERRIVTTLGWSAADMEPCSVIRYGPGHAYQPHCDFFTDEQIALNRLHAGDLGGQRLATFLLYLRAPERGGETDYPHAGVRVAGRRGMAVVHWNVRADGSPDPASLHAGLPVEAGEKWLWRSTLRAHPMYA